jgi:membrane protein
VSRLVRDTIRGFWAYDGFFLAAGLSFYVLICVVPFILLLIAGGGFLLSNDRVVDEVVTRITEILPVYQSDVEEILTGVVRARGLSSLLGTVILLVFASQLLAATRFVLNRVCGLRRRTFFGGMLLDVAMIVLLTLLFFVTVGVTAAFVWAQGILGLFGHGRLFTAAVAWAGLFLAVVFDTILFLAVYRLVPGVRLSWGSVLAGSVTAAVLWEVAKQLFRLYIEGVGVYRTMYGPLGVTIALIMWVYYSAIVFVLGAVVIRALEDRRRARAAV